MAQVVLENVYKSFPTRHNERVTPVVAQSSPLAPLDAPAMVEHNTKESHKQSVSVLRNINLSVADGEFMVLVGPSGCGKSTLLRLIAGLEKISGGNIWVGDRLVNELPPKARDIAMVFQNYALYPHMTVYDNLAFGLRRTMRGEGKNSSRSLDNLLVGVTRGLPKNLRYTTARERAIDERVRNVAQLLQIEALLNRLPKQLSGGQKQRVALGRAIARNPQVFLMDEPLSNLDAKLRAETRAQIVKLQRQLGTTTVYVTHDQTEAMTMGDRIAVMNQGQIQQVAPPLELYNRPATRFVAEFIGSPPMNFLPVQFHAPLSIAHPQFHFALPEQWANVLQNYDRQTLILGIRPEHFYLSAPAPQNLLVQVDLVEALGNDTYLAVSFVKQVVQPSVIATAATNTLQVRIPPDRKVAIGEHLWLSLSLDKLHFFEYDSGQAIWFE
ncbi:ATP-binding cassette domain-containing protein [Gloeocapsopsis sp. IPPAS B-1203]|uniref:ABC transporter ATP-binding protein n=1 Tax=Gloeocapsopsis sp. IPPAS B-1203 TaxID=2049454 RepID=UPI000C1A5C25|nr:ATP-binding cassette domain-containing protein [Gloeocapsopsis sp. IPPAS B-1203]PIG94444.1 sugar ABC transporter ATP-binding protein [Gloeocapsopsis sp. IPPAS B-1203]